MFCNHCGATAVDTAVICIKCGSPLTPVVIISVPDSPNTTKKLIMWGWVTAVILPILGLGLGVYNAIKGNIGHGVGQIVVSLFFWSFWAGFFAAIGF